MDVVLYQEHARIRYYQRMNQLYDGMNVNRTFETFIEFPIPAIVKDSLWS